MQLLLFNSVTFCVTSIEYNIHSRVFLRNLFLESFLPWAIAFLPDCLCWPLKQTCCPFLYEYFLCLDSPLSHLHACFPWLCGTHVTGSQGFRSLGSTISRSYIPQHLPSVYKRWLSLTEAVGSGLFFMGHACCLSLHLRSVGRTVRFSLVLLWAPAVVWHSVSSAESNTVTRACLYVQ